MKKPVPEFKDDDWNANSGLRTIPRILSNSAKGNAPRYENLRPSSQTTSLRLSKAMIKRLWPMSEMCRTSRWLRGVWRKGSKPS